MKSYSRKAMSVLLGILSLGLYSQAKQEQSIEVSRGARPPMERNLMKQVSERIQVQEVKVAAPSDTVGHRTSILKEDHSGKLG